MTENTTGKTGRGGIEQMLHELTGFKRDSAEIAGALLLIDTYIAGMVADLGGTPAPVIESYLHLLYQQSELLLDSSRRLAAINDGLALTTARVELIADRVDQLGQDLSDLRPVDRPVQLTEADRAEVRAALDQEAGAEAAAEITRMTEGWDSERLLPEPPLPDWERDLLDANALGVRTAGEHTEVYCRGCYRWRNSKLFFRNAKSRTGYESKCRECRKEKAA
jgi:hypothetical protein